MKHLHKTVVKTFLLVGLLSLIAPDLYCQVTPQIKLFRDEDRGNTRYRRKGTLDGNLVRTVYGNDGQVSDWFSGVTAGPHGEWPKGSAHRYLDGLTPVVAAKFHHKNFIGNDVTIKSVETSYREEVDKDPDTQEEWVVQPVPGYANASAKSPAININKNTFPEAWPRSVFYDLYGTDETQIKEWDGFWYGYFGRGVSNAQLETFFVIDDSKDKEFTRPPWNYWPIGDSVQLKNTAGLDSIKIFHPDSTRGGIGIRTEVRAFQWTHVLAEDIIFWHYDIINLANNTYDSTVFGFFSDPGVGSIGANSANFDRNLDMAYAWSSTGYGTPGNYKTGYVGIAFLESPGNGANGIDDDGDGMYDEKRDDGVDNDKDWKGYTDVNGDGKWQIEEPLNDDLGKDGVGPFDPQYASGGGRDIGEGDGIATLGEPNFDRTDKDESDQIGLQSAYIGPLLETKGEGDAWPKSDNEMWRVMNLGFTDTSESSSNITIVFASGIFPLKKNQRERFSIAILFGDDLPDLNENKITVQSIYNANYNFAQPPLTPTLTAVPGDQKVFLYWDAVAEKSYDRFLDTLDFEGYLLYRSNEAEFQDIKVVTDSKGQPKFWKPIAQWDLIDTIKGPDPVGVNGAHFWRGEDNGLQHSYVDNDVLNGKKYYYALVSYDRGVEPKIDTGAHAIKGGLTPSECTKIISEDFNGTLKFIDINCAVVTPSVQSAGYVPPEIEGSMTILKQGIGTGKIELGIVNPAAVLEGYSYQVHFDSTGKWPYYNTSAYSVIRTSPGGTTKDTVLKNVSYNKTTPITISQPFDGLTLTIQNDTSVTIDQTKTGWAPGRRSNIAMTARPDSTLASSNLAWPSDYEIEFFGIAAKKDKPYAKGSAPGGFLYIDDSVSFTVRNTTHGYLCKFLVLDMNKDGKFSYFDSIKIMDGYNEVPPLPRRAYSISFMPPILNPDFPFAGDKFVVKTKKPFSGGDYFEFTTHSSKVNIASAKNDMSKISVVPNPYVVASQWEPRNIFQSGRGDRKIDFIHLPAICTVRIYTVNGLLVKTLQKKSTADNGSLSWNLISEDGTEVAYGLYIYHIDAGEIGTHIGKFAVIK